MKKLYLLMHLMVLSACGSAGKAHYFPVTMRPPSVATVDLDIAADKVMRRALANQETMLYLDDALPKD